MSQLKELIEKLTEQQLEDLRNAKSFDEEIRIQQAYNHILINLVKEEGKKDEQN